MASSINAVAKKDLLSNLQAEVTEFADRNTAAPDSPHVAARNWARAFGSLGHELRRCGYARQLMAVTIGVPSDTAAIDVLRLACTAGAAAEDADVFQRLAARLEVVLSVDAKERDRFISSLKNVLRRLTIFHC